MQLQATFAAHCVSIFQLCLSLRRYYCFFLIMLDLHHVVMKVL